MNRYKAVRYLAYFLEIIVCYIVQTTPGFTPEVFGGRPVLMIPLALSIAVFEDEIPAIFWGVACGLLSDTNYSGPVGYYAIMLAILCYCVDKHTCYYFRAVRTFLYCFGIYMGMGIFPQALCFKDNLYMGVCSADLCIQPVYRSKNKQRIDHIGGD